MVYMNEFVCKNCGRKHKFFFYTGTQWQQPEGYKMANDWNENNNYIEVSYKCDNYKCNKTTYFKFSLDEEEFEEVNR